MLKEELKISLLSTVHSIFSIVNFLNCSQKFLVIQIKDTQSQDAGIYTCIEIDEKNTAHRYTTALEMAGEREPMYE